MNNLNNLSINIGFRLKCLRDFHGYTEGYVAKYIGKSRGAYEHYEAGRAEPSISSLLLLAELYEFGTIEELLAIDQLPKAPNKFLHAYQGASDEQRRIVDFILSIE